MKYIFFIIAFMALQSPLFAEEQTTPSPEEPSVEDGGINYTEYYEALKKQYDELLEHSSKKSSDAYEWVQNDFKNMFTWEYHVTKVPVKDEDKLQEMLKELGEQRWELVQVVKVKNELRLFLKRHPKSYLKSLPLRELLRIFPGGSGAGD